MARHLVIGTITTIIAVIGCVLGAGLASGDGPFYGQTYAKAVAKLQSDGGTASIATVVGSQLPTDDCVVTHAYQSITLDSTGRAAHAGRWLFDLNCNQVVAEPGKPGNSAATPEGAEAKKIKGYITYWNSGHPESCTPGASAQWCAQQCDKYGGCSADVEQYLANNS